jgi:hypothetical protein
MASVRTLKYPTVAFLGLLLLLSPGCSANDSGTTNESESVGTPESPITSEQLVDVFQRGPYAVKKTYIGKTLIVCGKIQGIDGAPGQVILAGRTGDPNSVPWISCKPKSECVKEFQSLQLGDVITATGVAYHVGKNDLFLRDCALLTKQAIDPTKNRAELPQ